VYSKNEFENTKFNDENLEQYPNDYFICINATGFVHSIPHFKKEHSQVLNCYFDDTEQDINKYDDIFKVTFEAKALTSSQATTIKHFINAIPSSATLHIYCPKGKSRSTAVAKFAGKADVNTYNKHVYNLLCSI
jgi:predicted protein tyrosine phosphatase